MISILTKAHSYETTCSKSGTVVIFSNGLNSTYLETVRSAKELEKQNSQLNRRIDKNNKILPLYKSIHNSRYQDFDDSIISRYLDFLTTSMLLVKNKAKLEYKLTLTEQEQLRFILELSSGFKLDEAPDLKTLPNLALFIAELVADYQAQEIELLLENLQKRNVQDLTKEYRLQLKEGKRILAVPHGEASIIHSLAHDLTFDATFEMIGQEAIPQDRKDFFTTALIAPANQLYSKGTYRTYFHDRYYEDILSTINLSPPPWNFTNLPIPDSDQWNHNFISTYMNYAIRGPTAAGEEYFGTLGGIIEAAEMLKSDCGLPPKAEFTYESSANDSLNPNPLRYKFDASTSTDEDLPDPEDPTPVEPPDYDIKKFTWYIDDVLQPDQMVITHTFLTEGSHKVRLMVTDMYDNESEVLEKTIDVVNQAPKADFNYTATDLKVSFSGSDSTDVDGRIAEYHWKILGTEIKKSVPTFDYTFNTGGYYDVELIVVDSNGKLSAPVIKTITVGAKRGCKDPLGNLYPGKTHLNPDGSLGGFVADTVTVTGEVHVAIDSFLCGDSIVSGSVFIEQSSVENTIIESESTSTEYNRIYIGFSNVKTSDFHGKNHSIYQSRVTDSVITGFNNVLTLGSSSENSIIEGGRIGIISSNLKNAKISRPFWGDIVMPINSSLINSNIISTDSSNNQSPIRVFSAVVNKPISGWSLTIEGVTVNNPISGSCLEITPTGSTQITEDPWSGCL